jgi:hypothetical protein
MMEIAYVLVVPSESPHLACSCEDLLHLGVWHSREAGASYAVASWPWTPRCPGSPTSSNNVYVCGSLYEVDAVVANFFRIIGLV